MIDCFIDRNYFLTAHVKLYIQRNVYSVWFLYSSSFQFILANIPIFSHCFNAKQYMNAFDQAMNALDEEFFFLSSPKQIVSDMNEEKKVRTWEILSMRVLYHLFLS